MMTFIETGGVSGARASRPQFEHAIAALSECNAVMIATADRLGWSTQKMLVFSHELCNSMRACAC